MSESYRVPGGQIQLVAPLDGPGSHYEVTIDRPIKEISDLGYALHRGYTAHKWLPGDRITIKFMERVGSEWIRLREVAETRVVQRYDHPPGVEIAIVGPIVKIPQRKMTPSDAAVKEVAATNGKSSGPAIPGDLSVVDVGGGFEVRDKDQNVIEQFVDRDQAREYADSQNAKAMQGDKVVKARGKKFDVKRRDNGEVLETFDNKAEAEAFAAA